MDPDLQFAMDHMEAVMEASGFHHGAPMPCAADKSRPLVLAKGAPYSDFNGHGPDFPLYLGPKPKEVKDSDPALYLVNSWDTTPRHVALYRDKLGGFAIRRNNSRSRLDLFLNSMVVRTGSTLIGTEQKAMKLLEKKISEGQWDSYVLSGAFPETSPRSDVTYIFRKGLPTIAMRLKPLPDGGGERRYFLAALCLHSMAYYESTHVGSYPPTDDVITHLLMMRSDEHKFWAKAVQHSLNDPRSGI